MGTAHLDDALYVANYGSNIFLMNEASRDTEPQRLSRLCNVQVRGQYPFKVERLNSFRKSEIGDIKIIPSILGPIGIQKPSQKTRMKMHLYRWNLRDSPDNAIRSLQVFV
jgi:hypothetical protein